jgi:hypothetical protein
MWLNANNSQAITISVKDVDDVEDFIYLGTTISKTGGTNVDIRRRIDHARVAFNKLHKIWSSNQLNRKTKVKLFISFCPGLILLPLSMIRNQTLSSPSRWYVSMFLLVFLFFSSLLVSNSVLCTGENWHPFLVHGLSIASDVSYLRSWSWLPLLIFLLPHWIFSLASKF